jgi:hypothetical protein
MAHISYFDSSDRYLTLTGSRNAHSALDVWSNIITYSYEEQTRKAVQALEIAVLWHTTDRFSLVPRCMPLSFLTLACIEKIGTPAWDEDIAIR